MSDTQAIIDRVSEAQMSCDQNQIQQALVDAQAELERLQKTWKCFHCNFETSDPKEAEVHFGDEGGMPTLCLEWASMDDAERAHAYQQMTLELNATREELLQFIDWDENLSMCPGCNRLATEVPHADGDLHFCASCHKQDEQQAEIERLRALVAAVHPRIWKLIGKQRDFLVIGEHEPYYMRAYEMIRDHEMAKGTWDERDRVAYASAQLKTVEDAEKARDA